MVCAFTSVISVNFTLVWFSIFFRQGGIVECCIVVLITDVGNRNAIVAIVHELLRLALCQT